MSTTPGSPVQRIGEDSQGRTVLLAPYNEDLASKAVGKSLAQQTDSDPETRTPDVTSDEASTDDRRGGPIRRFNDVFTDLGSVQLEAIALDGYEIARATSKYRDELFRNDFPLLVPRFVLKCETCDTEYNEEVDACLECTRQFLIEEGIDPDPPRDLDLIDEQYWQGELRPPEAKQKREAERLFESVNKEGQSLRDLYKLCEDDHARLGIGIHIVRWDYAVATGDSNVFEAGEIIFQDYDELVRADPKRVVPVVDENGRIGNYWWACPVHRPPNDAAQVYKEPGRCEVCNAELQEVFYVEKEDGSRSTRKPAKYFFDHEVIDWAFWFPRLNGKDGLSPAHHVWLKQSILHWMDVYGAAFYDPSSDRYPNKFMVVHTTNPETWERNFEKAEDDAKENPYSQQIMMNEYSSESQSTPEVQVIDLMNDELLGQDDALKKRFKSDIRQQWSVSDVFDSEMEDAGGLNNEGLQLEVTDRGIATRQHDLATGPLDELCKLLGISDYTVTFIPPQDEEVQDRLDRVKLGNEAARGGLEPKWEDGDVEIPDGEFEAPDDGGMGGFGGFGGGGDEGGGGEDLFADFSDGQLTELATKLSEGYEHLIWAEEEQKADPFFSEDEDVPEFVREAIERVIENFDVVYEDIDGLTSSQIRELERLFKENLTQPQGWSLRSLADDIERTFGVDAAKAEVLARTEGARVLNKAKEEAYRAQDADETAKFKWIGPADHRTTDACEWLKKQTSDGVTMKRLEELVEEAADKFFPELDYRGDWVVHPSERHTFVTSHKSEHGDAPNPGTFAEVSRE